MQIKFLLPISLAALVTSTAVPKEARQASPVTCNDPTLGPLLYQFERAISSLGGHGESVFTLPSAGTCARVETYGTAGLNLCGASRQGAAVTAFKYRDLAPYFKAIKASCTGADEGIWTKVNGGYTIESANLPNGTLWAYVYTEAVS